MSKITVKTQHVVRTAIEKSITTDEEDSLISLEVVWRNGTVISGSINCVQSNGRDVDKGFALSLTTNQLKVIRELFIESITLTNDPPMGCDPL